MRPFRLLALPILQLKRVIFLMDNLQRIKLAVCSDGAEEIIRQVNISLDSIVVRLADDIRFALRTTVFPMEQVKVYFTGISEKVKKEFKAEKIDKRIVSSRYQKEEEKEVHFEMTGSEIKFDSADLLKWMSHLFPRAKFGWWIDFTKVDIDVLERLYPVPHFNLAYFIDVGPRMASSVKLKRLMNRMTRLEEIYIYSRIPLKFRYQKALSYNVMSYSDARWIKLEDLLLVKGCLTIRRTTFDNEDLNQFLKQWKSAKEDFLGCIHLHLKKGVDVDQEIIRKDFVLSPNSNGFTILCDNYLERKRHIACVIFSDDSKEICFEFFEKTTHPFHYEMLVLLNKKLGLIERIKVVDGQMEQCPPEEYRELVNIRQDLEHQLEVTMRQLQETKDAERARRRAINHNI